MATRLQQPLLIRVTHWLNVPLLVIIAGSGLTILNSFPDMGPKGSPYFWYPHGKPAPELLTIGGWLAGARHIHFGVAWFLALNGLIYVVYLIASGEWRRRWFQVRRDAGNALQTALYYVRIRKLPPEQGLYNGLQRFAYTSAIVLAVLEVLSGLALYKPVQLSLLAALFGGYDGARAIHLLCLIALGLFTLGHLTLVALHPRELLTIFTGGKRESAAVGKRE
jgi:thiosulfate reductase cytochrome b subunit